MKIESPETYIDRAHNRILEANEFYEIVDTLHILSKWCRAQRIQFTEVVEDLYMDMRIVAPKRAEAIDSAVKTDSLNGFYNP